MRKRYIPIETESPGFDIPDPEAPVLVIGASALDIVAHVKENLSAGTSIPARIRYSYGGVARNVAENLARLGQPVRLLSVVGDDDIGHQLLQQAEEAGIDISPVLITEAQPTCTYMAAVDPSSGLLFGTDDMRAMKELSPVAIRERSELFKGASVLFVDGNVPRDTLRTVMSMARRERLPVCADPAAAGLAERLRPYLPRLTLVTPNGSEASVLTGLTFNAKSPDESLQIAKQLVTIGVEIAIITLGDAGVCYATSQTSGYIPAVRTQVLDPTGAGDALTATVIFSLLNEIPLDDALQLAVSAASLTLRYPGSVVPDLTLQSLYDRLV
jgi:pseudouridine kinase